MRKILPVTAVSLLLAFPSLAGDWSLGAGTGAFVFCTFAKRTTRINNGTGDASSSSRLSAATRPGGSADLQRAINDRFAVRLDVSWTRAPLKIKSGGGSGVSFDAGHASITTVALPLMINLNPHGTFQFHVGAGPAYALYDIKGRSVGGATFSLVDGARGRWGGIAGGGVSWWLGQRFAVEADANDIVTTSPFERSDFGPSQFGGLEIPKTHNVHTTVGIRYRF